MWFKFHMLPFHPLTSQFSLFVLCLMIFITNSQLRYSGMIKFSLSLFQGTLQDVSGIIDGKQIMTVSVFHIFPYNCTTPALYFIFLQYNNNNKSLQHQA
jgi:hypothetical protein